MEAPDDESSGLKHVGRNVTTYSRYRGGQCLLIVSHVILLCGFTAKLIKVWVIDAFELLDLLVR
jgi:hypothetical protein